METSRKKDCRGTINGTRKCVDDEAIDCFFCVDNWMDDPIYIHGRGTEPQESGNRTLPLDSDVCILFPVLVGLR